MAAGRPSDSVNSPDQTIRKEFVDAIKENATYYREKSKSAYENLDFTTSPTPSVEGNRKRCVGRLIAFRTLVLGSNEKEPFTCEELIRFLDTLVDVIKPRSGSSPSWVTINDVQSTLIEYGFATWSDFKFSKYDHAQLKKWKEKAVKENRITLGSKFERVWIGLHALLKLSTAWFRHATERGCFDWDVVIARALSVVLVSAVHCRGGDLVLCPDYGVETGYYTRWADVTFTLDTRRNPTINDLELVIKLNHSKGHKLHQYEYNIVRLRPLRDLLLHVVDPCLLLLILALRTGQAQDNTIEGVLQRAAKDEALKIRWNDPLKPLIPAVNNTSRKLDLDKPAVTGQLLLTMQKMGVMAGIVGRIYTHALKNGAMRDLAHVPASEFDAKGYASEISRQNARHQPGSTKYSENYVGENTILAYNARAAHLDYPDPRRPLFLGSESQEQAHNNIGAQDGGCMDKKIPSDLTQKEEDGEHLDQDIPIDPALFSDTELKELLCPQRFPDSEAGEQGHDTVQCVDAVIGTMELAMEKANSVPIPDDQYAFIEKFSKINIYRSRNFAMMWGPDLENPSTKLQMYWTTTAQLDNKDLPSLAFITHLNSRDRPTPWIYKCEKTVGCNYKTISDPNLQVHEQACTEASVRKARALETKRDEANKICTICGASLTNSSKLSRHMRDSHGSIELHCPLGCLNASTKVYRSQDNLNLRIKNMHSVLEVPVSCPRENCSSIHTTKADQARHAFEAHGKKSVRKRTVPQTDGKENQPPKDSRRRKIQQ